jgi:PPOX class probable F420-dependent enzyme
MTTDTLTRLGDGKYLLVTTFRKNGEPVPTPVWVVREGDALLIWTVTDSGKVKRMRRDSRVQLAPCDLRGTPHGDSVDATARILDPVTSDKVRKMIVRKYGIVAWVTSTAGRIRRGRGRTVGVELSLSGPPSAPQEA